MDSLGQYLRSIREKKALTIEAVFNEIKISQEQIEAIENNQLSDLGNYGIVRAMVYTYSRYLEADEKMVMHLFDMIWPPQNQSAFNPKTPIKEQKVLISINFIWLITIIIIVIFLGSIIWISYSRGYLKRPFDSIKKSNDSIRIESPEETKIEKTDTLRNRMLQIANSPAKQKQKEEKKLTDILKGQKEMIADTTDYVNEFIFNTEDSPFNSRF